jgi:hypothetical protein
MRGVVDSPGFQAMAESAATSQKLAEVPVDSPAFRIAAELGSGWQRFMNQHAAGISEAIQAIQVVS